MLRYAARATIKPVGDDEVEVVISTAAQARDGHVLVPQGCDFADYLRNNVVLWQHDPACPVGNAEDIAVAGDKITARIRFAPSGTSAKADEIRGLVKSGVVKAVSVGFEPTDGVPLDPARPRGGQRITKWELLEVSFVSVPADTGAVVTARAKADWTVGASRDLAIEDGDEAWDGSAAEASIFAWAGGDDFNPKKARDGFLLYDASAPKKRGSYKCPIARAKDGKLVVPKSAIRAAASDLPKTDVPDDVAKRAQSVIDHYRKKAGMDDGDRSGRPAYTRNKPMLKRDLCNVSNLCYLLWCIGSEAQNARIEAALEGDGSDLPGVLAGIVEDLADALVAMTQEEVAEFIGQIGIGEDDDVLTHADDTQRAYIAAAKTERARAFRRAVVKANVIRAGKTLSKDTVDCLRSALAAHEEGMDYHRSAMRSHKRAAKEIRDLMDRSGVPGHEETGEDSDVQNVQSSGGKNEDDEGARSADFRKRQAELLQLTH